MKSGKTARGVIKMKLGKAIILMICMAAVMLTCVCYADPAASDESANGSAVSDPKEELIISLLEIWENGEVDASKIEPAGISDAPEYKGCLLYRYERLLFFFEQQSGNLVYVNVDSDPQSQSFKYSEDKYFSKADETFQLIYGNELEEICKRRIDDAGIVKIVSYDLYVEGVYFPAASVFVTSDGRLSGLSMQYPIISEFEFGEFISEDESRALMEGLIFSYLRDNYQVSESDVSFDNEIEPIEKLLGDPFSKRVVWYRHFNYKWKGKSTLDLCFAVKTDALTGQLVSFEDNASYVIGEQKVEDPVDVDTPNYIDVDGKQDIVHVAAFSEIPEDKITPFVTRLYRNFLSREPDEAGLADWTGALIDGRGTAAKVVYGFVYSPEFQANPLSDAEYVAAMYETVFGREPDEAGLSAWVSVLEKGCTRKKILEGFLNSQEMKNQSADMGVEAGEYRSDDVLDRNVSVTYFVDRFYELCLGRRPDEAGIRAWVQALVDGKIDGAHVANAFFYGSEMKMKMFNEEFTDEQIIQIITKTLFDRDYTDKDRQNYDQRSYSYWMNFCETCIASKEFTNLCNTYGVTAQLTPYIMSIEPKLK